MRRARLFTALMVMGLVTTMALVGCESGGDSGGDGFDSYAGSWSGTGAAPSTRTVTVTVSDVDGTVRLSDTAGNSGTWAWNDDRTFGPVTDFPGFLEFESGHEGVVSYEGGDVTIEKQ